MLINLSEVLDRSSVISRPYKGTVVDNSDPMMLGRVKARIDGLIEGDSSSLPWCYPVSSSFLGGSTASGAFAVPEIGSSLVIEFPYEDIYSPFYTGHWISNDTKTPHFDTDYPNSYGLGDASGNKIIVNKTQETIELTHSSGTIIKITQNGDIELTTTGTIKLNGDMGRVLTTLSDPSVDMITGAPSVGVEKVKAG